MKDDVKDEVPNGTLKILNPSNGVLNNDGVSKLNNRLEGDHATQFFKLDKKTYHTKFSLEVFICKWYNWGAGLWCECHLH
jgi:hypothetical protein